MRLISNLYIGIHRVALLRALALSVCGILVCTTAFPETVSQKQAKECAQLFFNQAYRETTAPVKYVYNGKRLTTNRLLTPFYVYTHQRGGFVIVSAENKTFPILAYSLKGSFNPDKLSEGEKGWLKGYAMDIEMIGQDSRVPEKAIAAWQDYPRYVAGMLDAKYEATDPTITIEESEAMLDGIVRTPDYSVDGNFSAVYTSEQWKDMVEAELQKSQSVAIGYVDFEKHLYPGVIYGRKGDYFKIAFENRNDWMVRLQAAEYFGERLVASLSHPAYVAEPEPETPAFEYYESIREEHRKEKEAAELQEKKLASEPVVKAIGGGHFDILLPENATLAMLYNIEGSHIGRATYKGTPTAHINIEAEPRGFYFALIFGESGKPYGVKLYR